MKHYYRLLVLAIIVVTKFASSQIACAETLLRIATPGALTGALPIYLGGKKGVFSKYGLAVEVIATRNEQMNMQALMSDSVQFLTSSSTGLFYLGKQGLDAVGLASWNNSSPYSLASRVKIKDLKGLKGRKIASSGAGGRADAYIRFMDEPIHISFELRHRTKGIDTNGAEKMAARILIGIERGQSAGQNPAENFYKDRQAVSLVTAVIPRATEG